jgi:HEPN domain-containing protein
MPVTLVDEWVEKAEADYQGAMDLNRRRKAPLPNLVCYHCQQSAEKYLKAYLIAQGTNPPLIHGLVQLLNLCITYDPTLTTFLPHARILNPFSVTTRYPGTPITVADARDALSALRPLRRALRRRLGL